MVYCGHGFNVDGHSAGSPFGVDEQLTQNRLHKLTLDVCQTEIASLKAVGQSGMIESQLVENRGLHIMHMDRILTTLNPNSSVTP